jgi:hypothetical protein
VTIRRGDRGHVLPALLWSRAAPATLGAAAAEIRRFPSARGLLLVWVMTNLQLLRNVTRQLDLFPMAHAPTRIGLIACSKRKLDHAAPARELYTGPVFGLSRKWMESRAAGLAGWAILSAKHGLLMPDDVVEPYDLSLDSLTAEERRAWADRTRAQIVARWGTDRPFMVLAGDHYREALYGLSYVEDVIGSWGRWRRDEGLRPAHCSIGLIRKYLSKNCNAGAGCR